MALIPLIKARTDDLFTEWLSEPDVQSFLIECLQLVKSNQHAESELDSPTSANQIWTSLNSTSQQQILGLGVCAHCNVFHARSATSSNRPTSARYGNGSNKLSIHLNSPLAPLPSPRSPRKPLASPTDPHPLSSPAASTGYRSAAGNGVPKGIAESDQVPGTIALGRAGASSSDSRFSESRESPASTIPLVADRDSRAQTSLDQLTSDASKKLNLV